MTGNLYDILVGRPIHNCVNTNIWVSKSAHVCAFSIAEDTYNFKEERERAISCRKIKHLILHFTCMRDAIAFIHETVGLVLLNVQSCSSRGCCAHWRCGFFKTPTFFFFWRFAQAPCSSGSGSCGYCVHAASVPSAVSLSNLTPAPGVTA